MIRTGVFDLETSNLDADYGVLLCAVIKASDSKKLITLRTDDNLSWQDGFRGNDKEIVSATADLLSGFDVLVAHNGTRFDIPFLRTRLLRWGLPRLPDIKVVDPCSILWRKFKLHRNSLAALIDHLGLVERKTPLDMSVWSDAVLNGSRGSMDKIVKHCQQDVKVLAEAFNAVKPYLKVIDDRGSSL